MTPWFNLGKKTISAASGAERIRKDNWRSFQFQALNLELTCVHQQVTCATVQKLKSKPNSFDARRIVYLQKGVKRRRFNANCVDQMYDTKPSLRFF